MMGQNLHDYAVGKRVYRGASSAPTRGKVDPLGYKERDQKRRLQEAAMRRLRRSK